MDELETKRERLRHRTSLLMAFFLAVSLALLAGSLAAGRTLLREDTLKEALTKSGYYPQVGQEIQTRLGYKAEPFGIPKTLLEGLYDEEQLRTDIDAALDAARTAEKGTKNGTENPESGTFLKTELTTRLTDYLRTEGIGTGTAQLAAVDEYGTLAKGEYTKGIRTPFFKVWASLEGPAWKAAAAVTTGAAIATTIFATLLYKLHRSRKALPYFTHALLGGGLITLTLPGAALLAGTYQNLQIAPESLYNLLQELITSVLWSLILAGTALVLLGLALALMESRLNPLGARSHTPSNPAGTP